MGQLDGKRIIVTGAAQGIGAAIAQGYLSEGAKVAKLDLQFKDGVNPFNFTLTSQILNLSRRLFNKRQLN